jgi:hypothetical protein
MPLAFATIKGLKHQQQKQPKLARAVFAGLAGLEDFGLRNPGSEITVRR